MSRKRQLISIAIIFSILLLAWGSWYLYSLPGRYKTENIDEVFMRTYAVSAEYGPAIKIITEKEDIEKFVQLFNSFKIRPRISSPAGYGGWDVLINIKQNQFPGDVGLSILEKKIMANGKIYSINKEAKDKLNELFLQENFGEMVVDR